MTTAAISDDASGHVFAHAYCGLLYSGRGGCAIVCGHLWQQEPNGR